MTWFKRLSIMTGRLALLSEAEAALLARYVSIPGDHIDIGCLWGGTAILAALAKRDAGVPGNVVTIDPMQGGWWDSEDPAVKLRPTYEIIKDNFDKFHLHSNIYFIPKKSNPWPVPKRYKPTSILIDGDHRFESVASDWRNASATTARYILFHDYNSSNHPGVQRAVDDVARAAPGWNVVEQDDSMIIFERAKKRK